MSELEKVREYEENNYRWAKQELGDDALGLVQQFVDLYDLMGEICRTGPAKFGYEDLAAISFLLTCRYELTMGSLDILRTHLVASYPHTRRAIETCAFARRVNTDPSLIALWSNAGDDEASYWKYYEQFKSKDTFPKSHKLLRALYDRYTTCSRRSHPSVLSIGLQAKIEQSPTTTNIEVGYFQIAPSEKVEPLLTLLWTLDIHFGIIRLFEEVLADLLSNDPARWAVQRNAVDTQLMIQKARLQAIMTEARASKPAPLIWLP